MSNANDDIKRELRRLDPARPSDLDAAAESGDAAAMLARIVATDPDAAAGPAPVGEGLPLPEVDAPRWRRRSPALAFGAAAAVAVAVLIAVLALTGGGEEEDQLSAALDGAAARAAAAPSPAGAQPFTYLKTREISVRTTDADRRSWNVDQSTTREEWVTPDGSGRLRIVAGPSRFVGSGDRVEWEGAGRPRFLTLGFGGRTEDRWISAGQLRGRVVSLPIEPGALAVRLTEEAADAQGEGPLAAATLQLIAEDLRNPVASPELRRALYEAAKRIPGIEYLGDLTDADGRSGVGIGVTSSSAGRPRLYSLIFDPDTSQVLATEETALSEGGPDEPAGPTLLRATVYEQARGTRSLSEKEGMWLSGFEPSAFRGQVGSDYLIYRVPGGVGTD
ncbi:MAG TPA: CU044_5270 family protein [Solirubrobacterales bacterium]|nr:CU044_5270 family protein [Solirubrobacterales bacterium]